jgi:hypothetical protein
VFGNHDFHLDLWKRRKCLAHGSSWYDRASDRRSEVIDYNQDSFRGCRRDPEAIL